ncbi:MAG: hypothetical protein ABIP93_07830 [Gemmatimonadaceae bacterium]
MRHLTTCTLTLASAIFLAACAGDNNGATAVPTSVSEARAVGACSFSTVRNDARGYFASTKDPVFDLISTMETGFRSGGSAGATGPGYDVLAYLASALKSAATPSAINGTPAAGSKFVGDLVGCMSVGTVPAGFSVEAALGANGLFEVPSGTASYTSRSAPIYGAEPQADWNISAGGQRYLLYGYPIDNFSAETAAGIAFELSTLPTPISFSPSIKAGVCSASGANPRLQHVGAILALETLSFCATAGLNRTEDAGMFGAARRAMRSLFLPQPLYAAMFFGGIGAALDNLSPSVPVVFPAADVVLSWAQQPTDTRLGKAPQQFTPTVAVKLVTAKGTALGQVPITLTVVGNSGSFIATGTVQSTKTDGIAYFPDFHLDKAGGYTITASVNVIGSTKSVVSSLFNVRGGQ